MIHPKLNSEYKKKLVRLIDLPLKLKLPNQEFNQGFEICEGSKWNESK
jgi:hypothetical protein